jgi:O-antigen/teichoic acid export membrane protein
MKLRIGLPRRMVVLGSASAVAWLLNLVGLAYLARSVGSTALGLLVFGLSITAYASVISAPGLNVWGVRAVSRHRGEAGTYLFIVNGTQLVLGAVAYLVIVVVAFIAIAQEQRQIVIVSGIGVFSAFAGTQWLCQALERYDLLAVSMLVTASLSLVGFVLFVHGSNDVYVVPLIMFTAQVIASSVILTQLRIGSLVQIASASASQVIGALRTSIALGVAPAIITIFHNANTLILQVTHGSEAVGLFSSGFRLVEVLALIPTLVTSLFFPRLARLTPSGDSWQATMRAFVSVTLGLAFFPAVLLFVEAEGVTNLLYGADFAQAVSVVRIMGVAVLFNFAAIAYLMALLSAHQDRRYLIALGATAAFSIGAGIVVVPGLGLLGAAVVVSALDLIAWLFTLPTLRRFSRDCFLSEWRRPALGAAATGIWLILAEAVSLPFVARVALALVVYTGVVFVRTASSRVDQIVEI